MGFNCKPHKPYKCDRVFDTDYIDIEIQEYVVKTGEGDTDFVVKKKIIEHKRPIAEVIESQRGEADIHEIVANCMRTGDFSKLISDMNGDGQVVDMTGAPTSYGQVFDIIENSKEMFNQLPADLVKGRNYEEFISSLTYQEFNDWLASLNRVEGEENNG